MMGEGPSLGARRAKLPAVKLFGWDDAKNAELRKAETGTICETRLGASGE